jgi:hypothetical protein
MRKLPVTIEKAPTLKPAEDFYRLRREGIGFIEQLSSSQWTNYNTHDPGITILEALCYAITDLAYRISWNIKDILASPDPPVDPNQPFFTARDILTVNPVTSDDFRRLLIDLDTVRNAWVFGKACACDLYYYAWCEEEQLILSYQKPPNLSLQSQKVEPLGLYDILLELETDPELGDLNDRKIVQTCTLFDAAGKPHPVTIELRFPEWELARRNEWKLFLEHEVSFDLTVSRFGATKAYDVLTEPNLDEVGRNQYLRDHWRHVFYVKFEIELAGGENITIENAALRILGDTFVKSNLSFDGADCGLKTILEDKTPFGFIQHYRKKMLKVTQALADARASLHDHRNLCEDYCHMKVIDVEDVAVCADVEVAPDADIERVQAEIWIEIEQYFNPPVPFYTLQELMDDGIPVEEIFNGPVLNCGFIKAKELDAAQLKTALRISDIINRLMDIEGVIAVNNLQLTKYDSEGHIITGAADPDWTNNGTPLFKAEKVSASSLLLVNQWHQPRLYYNQSRFLFYKNGLPFLPRMDEAYDTLIQLRGEAERPKIKSAPHDLPIPEGNFRNLEDYTPIQYSFPLTYGIGPDGLPSQASSLRQAQAKQMKAYLMVFEQHLSNAFAQLAHTADLFSLDSATKRTYFVHELSDALIKGYSDIIDGLNKDGLEGLTETLPEFHERRNRFLDHIMARFGEQFSEYALLLTNLEGRQVALDQLIKDKIFFLKAYPNISHNRGKASNYTKPPALPGNGPGLKKRVSLLLGYPDLTFFWSTSKEPNVFKVTHYELKDQNGTIWMTGELTLDITDKKENKAIQKAFEIIISQMSRLQAYQIVTDTDQFRLQLKDKNGDPLGQPPKLFKTKTETQAFMDKLLNWSSNERAIVVEHLLLRPKFPGDALYPACTEGSCKTCGDEDPYSFRLTFVMPAWTAPFDTNLDARDFAERTFRQETPAHLLGKICWVGNDGLIDNPCDPVLDDLAERLETQGLTAGGDNPTETEACDCASAIYTRFSEVFQDWYEDKTLRYFQPNALKMALETEFSTKVDPGEISCTVVLAATLWSEIQRILVEYFYHIALHGWQFERFEEAWRNWRAVNTGFDWTDEHLLERVQAILEQGLDTDSTVKKSMKDELCQCATTILTQYGMEFYNWMNANLNEGYTLENFTAFSPTSVTLCRGFTFKPNTAAMIETLLKDRYEAYQDVSYRLSVLVNLLSELRNTYPGATLHDCDEGNDRNPVRLGKTALGNYASKAG